MKLNKIALIGLVIVLAYSALGFFVVPRIAQNKILEQIQVHYGVTATVEKIEFNPFTFEVEVNHLIIPPDTLSGSGINRLELGLLRANLQIFPLLQKQIFFKSFYLSAVNFNLIVAQNKKTNWASNQVAEPEPQNPKATPWILTLEQVQIEDTKIDLLDQTHREPLRLPLGPINLSASNISTSLGSLTSLENLNILFGPSGHLQVDGRLSLQPLSVDLKFDLQRMPMQFITSYLSDRTQLAVKNGEINMKGQASYVDGRAKLRATAEINRFELIQPKTRQSVMGWESLSLSGIEAQTLPTHVRINEVVLTKLKTRLALKKDGVLSYKDYLRAPKAEKPAPSTVRATAEVEPAQSLKSENAKPFGFEVASLKIVSGELDYSDQQIKPNFSAHVSNLNGVIQPLSQDTNKKTAVNLNGRVEAQGQFTARGFVIPNPKQPKLNMDVNFNNIEMTTFTPYAGKFAGYEISKGKLFLKLNYTLQDRFIRGTNHAVLDQFTLGKAVESEDSTNLPVKLALALMKDRDGKIVINLPVEGSVNSPQFSFGGLVWTALKNMVVNIVAAPFDFLKSALGGGDNLDMIFFEPGQAVLSAAEESKLQQISKALLDRPSLVIEVQGRTQLADVDALKKIKVKSEISADELKSLGQQRGQLIQNTLVKLKVEAERVYLVAATTVENNDKAPHTVLHLKSRD